MNELHPLQIEPLVSKALQEDWGHADWTTDLCVPSNVEANAKIISKQDGIVVAGLELAEMSFKLVDPNLRVEIKTRNGEIANNRDEILTISGNARSILKAERVALNYLGRLCGISSFTRKLVEEVEGTGVQVLDTRKTTPGLRLLEKTAAALGGARNHRVSLTDGVMLKENHIRAAGGITAGINRLVEALPPTIKIEVETTNLEEVQEALDAGADIIMLDNMPLKEMEMAVRTVQKRAKLEASGNVNLENIRDVAKTGVDFISTSSMFHSSKGADLSLLFDV
jgi:nicotinate-nucleotide pyrophosphorylase (carboxylating)